MKFSASRSLLQGTRVLGLRPRSASSIASHLRLELAVAVGQPEAALGRPARGSRAGSRTCRSRREAAPRRAARRHGVGDPLEREARRAGPRRAASGPRRTRSPGRRARAGRRRPVRRRPPRPPGPSSSCSLSRSIESSAPSSLQQPDDVGAPARVDLAVAVGQAALEVGDPALGVGELRHEVEHLVERALGFYPVALRRARYERFFIRLPQISILHQLPPRLREES